MNISTLDGKAIVVTGAGRGIGAAITRRLLDLGAQVIALVQPGASHPELDGVAQAGGSRLFVLPADVTSTECVGHAVSAAREIAGNVDVLINNAGIIEPIGRLGDLDPDRWSQVINVNAGGAMRCTQGFLPLLLASRGVVVNMSSGAAYRPLEGWSSYCASKAAVVMLSRSTDLEYREQGIRVFSLGIPPTDTAMQGSIRASGLNEVSQIPRAGLYPPAMTAEIVAWLCSPDARELASVEIDVRDEGFATLFRE